MSSNLRVRLTASFNCPGVRNLKDAISLIELTRKPGTARDQSSSGPPTLIFCDQRVCVCIHIYHDGIYIHIYIYICFEYEYVYICIAYMYTCMMKVSGFSCQCVRVSASNAFFLKLMVASETLEIASSQDRQHNLGGGASSASQMPSGCTLSPNCLR